MSSKRIDAILTLKDKMTAPLSNAVTKLESSSRQIGKFGNNMRQAGKIATTVGGGMTKYITAPIVGAMVASGKFAADFQQSMAKVNTIADTTQVPMSKLQKQILALSNQTGVSASQIANNVYDAISAGQSTANAVKFVGNATKLAAAGFATTDQSLDVLTTTLNAYGMKSKEAKKVSDMLIVTQNLGKVTVGELAGTMGKLIPTANAYNVSLRDVDAGYITLTKNGIKARYATTYMNSMFNELGKSGTTVSKALKQASGGKDFAQLMKSGKSVDQILEMLQKSCKKTGTKFSDLWKNANSAKAANSILKHTNDYKKGLDALDKSAGTTQKAFEKVEATAPAQFRKSVNRIKNSSILLGQTLGAQLAPALTAFAKTIKRVTDAFAKMSPTQRRVVTDLLLMIATVGPTILIVGKLAVTIGNMSRMFATASRLGGILSPMGKLIIIATAVAMVATLIITHWDKVGPVFKKVWGIIKAAVSPAIALIKLMLSAVKDLVNFIIAVPSKIKAACGWIGKHVGKLTSGEAKLTINARAGGNAQGTPYWRGGLTHVNERGGEIMDLPTGTRIIPHDVSVEMAKAQAKNNNRTNIINIPKLADQFVVRSDADIDRIADALANRLEKLSGDLV